MRLAGKAALVTGAASGIGKGVVGAFVAEGAAVFAADIDYTSDPRQITDNPRPLRLDVTKEADWDQLSAKIGRVDVLVACAGISEAKLIAETSLSDWQRVMSVNLDGVF